MIFKESDWGEFAESASTGNLAGITLAREELMKYRLEEVDQDFQDRYPEASISMVYEFTTQLDAEKARVTLLSAAWGAGRGRVTRIRWGDKWRVIATP